MVLTANLSSVLLVGEAGTGSEKVLPEGNLSVDLSVCVVLLTILKDSLALESK